MTDFLDIADNLVRTKDPGIQDAQKEFDDVFHAIAELRTVYAKSYLDVDNIEILFGAIEMGRENWAMNDLPPEQHEGVCADVFEFLAQAKTDWDMVMVDPPSMAKSEKQKPKAIAAYEDIFAQAGKRVKPNGHLLLSSCSSHITFEDFFEIINQAVSKIRRKGKIIRVSGQGPDHPFPHACHELRYLKFADLVLD